MLKASCKTGELDRLHSNTSSTETLLQEEPLFPIGRACHFDYFTYYSPPKPGQARQWDYVWRIRLSLLTVSGVLRRRGRPEAPEETVYFLILCRLPGAQVALLLIHIATWPLAHELTHKNRVPRSHPLFRDKAVCFTPFTKGIPQRRVGWRLHSPRLPPPAAHQLHSIPVGPKPSLSGCGAVFYFIELIQASLRMVLSLNHRPRCPGQTALGHCWLGSWVP